MNFRYLVPRVFRHFLPETVARFLLRQRLLIRPGLETTDPILAVDNYIAVLGERTCTLQGKRVLIFGYGGRFAVGVELLRRGAGHVVLCDHIESMDHERNLQLFPQYEQYLRRDGNIVSPLPQYITLVHADIRDDLLLKHIGKVDFVFSTSVYEHLGDVPGITAALARLTLPDGVQVHFVDLRDHFFKYPFEMLTYSERVWYGWLNPSSHHNRYRVWDYRRSFEAAFENVDTKVLARDEDAFQRALPRIKPEFVTGNLQDDSVTLICVLASGPRR